MEKHMYKICKTPKSETRQLEFQETLLKMLEKQKMKDITIVSLCQEMGISRKTFYQYFDTIEDVLYMIVDKELRDGFLILEIKPQVNDFFEFWRRNKSLLDILELNEMSQILVDRAYTISAIDTKNEMFGIQHMKYAGWISGIITVLIMWHHGGMKQTSSQMQELLWEMYHLDEKIIQSLL